MVPSLFFSIFDDTEHMLRTLRVGGSRRDENRLSPRGVVHSVREVLGFQTDGVMAYVRLVPGVWSRHGARGQRTRGQREGVPEVGNVFMNFSTRQLYFLFSFSTMYFFLMVCCLLGVARPRIFIDH